MIQVRKINSSHCFTNFKSCIFAVTFSYYTCTAWVICDDSQNMSQQYFLIENETGQWGAEVPMPKHIFHGRNLIDELRANIKKYTLNCEF
jgi:hypothetical protein